MQYSYPAIFTPEDSGGYSVRFPDVQGGCTCGDDMEDAVMMAADVLSLMLSVHMENGDSILPPSPAANIALNPGEFVKIISCDVA